MPPRGWLRGGSVAAGVALALLGGVVLPAPLAKDKSAKEYRAQLDAQPDPVWPSPPDAPRVKWVRFLRDEYDVGAQKKSGFLDALAGKNKEIFALNRPIAVTADQKGLVYVLDHTWGLVRFDIAGKKMTSLSSAGGFSTENPVGIAADSRFLYVADSKKNTVAVLDFDGRMLRQVGDPKIVNWPVGVAVDEKAGLLFVVNGHGHQVLVFEKDSGKLIRTIGRRGADPGQLNYPTYVALLPGERLAVMDSLNFRVQIFNYSGKFLKTFGQLGDKPGFFFRPKGIASDSEGHIYVADGAFQNIQVFDDGGRLLGVVGEGGSNKGQFSLPIGLACVNDTIYVADQFNRRIQILQYLPEAGKGGGGKQER